MARILIIDDENNLRMMLRIALQHVGHAVETAADGAEGLEKFGNGAGWDLALLDQRMPGMEGLEVLRAMRERAPDARVIMITAFGTIDLAAEAMAAGAKDFLRKPFTVETLRGAVEAALQDSPGSPAAPPLRFDLVTVNGYRIESPPGVTLGKEGEIQDVFTIQNPHQETHRCTVLLPAHFVESVKAHANRREFPGGERFWQALCGEVLANYLWQHAEPPPENALRVEDLTSGLRHWIDAALAGGR